MSIEVGLSRKVLMTLLVVFVVCTASFAQKSSKNNYTGTWESTTSWTDGAIPPTANIGNTGLFPFNIYGYITRNGTLSFANINANAAGPNFIVNDTLVVEGDVTFENKAANLVLGPNAVMVVFGNFSATNKITVENGGILIVTGNMSFSNSGQDEYDNPGGGELYVGGTVSDNPDAVSDNDWDNLDTEYPDLWDFVDCGGACSLPIKLLSFEAVAEGGSIRLNWVTISEENFDKFVVQRSSGGLEFNDLGEVPGAGKDLFNIETAYTFVDLAPISGYNYYRLKALDLDLKSEIFDVVAVKVNVEKQFAVFPTTVTPGTSVSWTLNFNPSENDQISVMNSLGSVVAISDANMVTGKILFAEDLTPGIYFIHFQAIDYRKTTRVIVAR